MPDSTIDLEFADGEYHFALPLERIEELQRKCSIGIGGLFARLLKGCQKHPLTGQVVVNPSAGEFYAIDIIETLRQGLIGGGRGVASGAEIKVTPHVANQLINTAWSISFAFVLMIWAWGWTGGKALVGDSLQQAKAKEAERRDEKKRRKEAERLGAAS